MVGIAMPWRGLGGGWWGSSDLSWLWWTTVWVFFFLLQAPGPFSCYLLSPWSKKNNAMSPRNEQHHIVMECSTAIRVVRSDESGEGRALGHYMLLFQKTQQVLSCPAALSSQQTAVKLMQWILNIHNLQHNGKQIFLFKEHSEGKWKDIVW